MKKMAMAMIAGVAFGVGASMSAAHPVEQGKHTKKRLPAVKNIYNESPQSDFSDDFEAYDVGSDIVGQGGWEVWYTGGEHAVVSDDTAHSGKKSMKVHALSDIVQQFDVHDGAWVLTVYTYVPSAFKGTTGYIILMSGYNGGDLWNLQVRHDPEFGNVEAEFEDGLLSLITDQWVEFRAEIDLDNDLMTMYYNNDVLYDGAYTGSVNGDGTTDIAALDLFSAGIEVMYYDDVSLKAVGGGCYPDFNGDGLLDLFDFLGFVNAFNAGDAKADCDPNGIFDLFDFLCFVNAFNAGC